MLGKMKVHGEMMLNSKPAKLKRSRTLTTEWFPEQTPSPPPEDNIENNNFCYSTDEYSMPHRAPGPSCKALKHAVSALSRLDDFILEKLGEGFFAEVFKATHRGNGAVQVLKMNKIQDNRPNVLRELQLMNRLSHKNILGFMGVCVHEGQLHALTEYINGGDLEQLLANTDVELPWTVRMKIAHDIASGMVYLHSRVIMHRDLTSKNVLISKDRSGYTAVVGDFGLSAKIPDPQSKKQLSTVGSPFWMAPEVILGQNYNELADVFSYGVICCEVTARVSSDPDTLPRTNNFGIDYKAFSELIDYCPLDFLRLAFRCCQVDASKRPAFTDIETNTLQIYENLKNDNLSHSSRSMERRNSLDGSNYKRSRSEDNILSANGEEYIEECPDEGSDQSVTCTPLLIGEAMSRDDPFYQPSISNPFKSMVGFREGCKILGKSFGDVGRDNMFELPSPSSPTTPPCTPNLTTSYPVKRYSATVVVQRKSQSLPSSPVLLRRAAERLHQESIHGTNCRKSLNPNRYSFSAYGSRSKSAFFPEAVAQRLQFEMYDTGSPYTDRSRESSSESDTHFNFSNHPINLPRRHSTLECSLNSRVGMMGDSHSTYNGHTHTDSSNNHTHNTNERGDNCDISSNNQHSSVYPGLNYAYETSAKREHSKKWYNNNNLSSSIDSKVSFDDSLNSYSSVSSQGEICDPWSMRRETLTDTAIIEETICPGMMETSV